jgi:Fe-S cluster assembly protein SufB
MQKTAEEKLKRGLDKSIVEKISKIKKEPAWMTEVRLKALEVFYKKAIPLWGPDLDKLKFNTIRYYIRAVTKAVRSWKDLPNEIRQTYEEIGIPEAERDFLAGVTAQYESEVMYKSLKKGLEKKGIIFTDTDAALRNYPSLFRKYFTRLVSIDDNKFAALNTAVWSGGSFLYIPRDVELELPLQAYFRINSEGMGQFERTIIIAEKGSKVHYIEGCSAPIYSQASLHAAVVEVFVGQNARVQYTTIQNWSKNVYNLVTKRARVEKKGLMQWVDGNLGSYKTMKYPACILAGEGAKGEMLSLAYASDNQELDTGAKMIHLAKNTTSRIVSKSISKQSGRSSYRGLIKINKGAVNAHGSADCSALVLNKNSRSDTYPTIVSYEEQSIIEHEAKVSELSSEQLVYLMSRGISKTRAESLIVNGFIEPIVKKLPLEYAVEINRLITNELVGEVG